jgi:triacylglycerol lipase
MHLVLLHALARTALSMRRLGRDLEAAGHRITTIDYPSTRAPLPELARFVLDRLDSEGVHVDASVGFVGHSMGGLVYRSLPLARPSIRCGRSVVLGSPVNGSMVARALAAHAPFRLAYGPAFPMLAADHVSTLPPLPGPTLCIAGTRASPFVPAYWVLRALGNREPNDSTVLVREALHPDAEAHATVHAAHSFLASNVDVRRRVLAFVGAT